MINPGIQKKAEKDLHKFFNEKFSPEAISNLITEDFLKVSPEFYLYYPYLFKNAFNKIEEITIKKLNHAGFFCFKAVLLQDRVIDKQVSGNQLIDTEKTAKILMEEALAILKQLFGTNEFFWAKWAERKNELHASVLLDKTLDINNYTYERYRQLAFGKSVFANLAIDALFALEGKRSIKSYELLLESHREFSCAMQLFDDVTDLQEDNNLMQFNLAKHLTVTELNQRDIDCGEFSIQDYEKYFYILNVAERMFHMAFEHMNKASAIAQDLNVKAWQNVLHFYKVIFISVKQNIDTYLKKIKAETFHSCTKLLNVKSLHKPYPAILEEALEKGTEFILQHQNRNGSWSEYLTQAGPSDVWATGFILANGCELLPIPAREKASSFLLNHANPLWGYRESYFNDTDSSNFVLLGLYNCKEEIDCFADYLIERQNPDGGFPTYTAKEINDLRKAMRRTKSQSYEGWTQSHPCVTAVTYFLLTKAYEKTDQSNIQATEAYLLNCFMHKHSLTYWWTSNIYTVYYLLLAWEAIKSSILKDELLRSIHEIIAQQSEDGSFGDKFEAGSAYYTGYMAAIMLKLASFGLAEVNVPLKKSIEWLLHQQLTDGSWKQTHALQIPEPDCMTPGEHNWPAHEFGCQIRAIEFNRLYSTIISLNALNEYRGKYSENRYTYRLETQNQQQDKDC